MAASGAKSLYGSGLRTFLMAALSSKAGICTPNTTTAAKFSFLDKQKERVGGTHNSNILNSQIGMHGTLINFDPIKLVCTRDAINCPVPVNCPPGGGEVRAHMQSGEGVAPCPQGCAGTGEGFAGGHW